MELIHGFGQIDLQFIPFLLVDPVPDSGLQGQLYLQQIGGIRLYHQFPDLAQNIGIHHPPRLHQPHHRPSHHPRLPPVRQTTRHGRYHVPALQIYLEHRRDDPLPRHQHQQLQPFSAGLCLHLFCHLRLLYIPDPHQVSQQNPQGEKGGDERKPEGNFGGPRAVYRGTPPGKGGEKGGEVGADQHACRPALQNPAEDRRG